MNTIWRRPHFTLVSLHSRLAQTLRETSLAAHFKRSFSFLHAQAHGSAKCGATISRAKNIRCLFCCLCLSVFGFRTLFTWLTFAQTSLKANKLDSSWISWLEHQTEWQKITVDKRFHFFRSGFPQCHLVLSITLVYCWFFGNLTTISRVSSSFPIGN